MTSGIDGIGLADGVATGRTLRADEPLSFWGGLDVETGTIVDRHHPQAGSIVTGRVLAMPSGRGSSSSSSVLAEAIRAGTAPAGIVMSASDGIVALGALVAAELYGIATPVIVVSPEDFATIPDGAYAQLTSDSGRSVLRIR